MCEIILCSPPLVLELNEQKRVIGQKTNCFFKFLQVTFITYFQPKTLAKLAASKQYKSIKQRRLLDKNAFPLSLYISLSLSTFKLSSL